VKQDMSGVEAVDLPPMDAIASDDNGILAMASFAPPDPRAYVTDDGETLAFRPLEPSDEPSARVHLAVAGAAVAFAIEGVGAFVSRGLEEPFLRCEPLGTAGPVAFEGAAGDAALFGAARSAGYASIIRVDREGAALRIADFGSDGGPAPGISDLAWDASRRILWGASPQMGIVTCTAPGAKGAKKTLLS
jgi:hypothetical protein